jgi:hypothetical protein
MGFMIILGGGVGADVMNSIIIVKEMYEMERVRDWVEKNDMCSQPYCFHSL